MKTTCDSTSANCDGYGPIHLVASPKAKQFPVVSFKLLGALLESKTWSASCGGWNFNIIIYYACICLMIISTIHLLI